MTELDGVLTPETVVAPEIAYGTSGLLLDYMTQSDEYVRVAFDRLDSVRLARGEYPPYPSPDTADAWFPFSVVRPSDWLEERYRYESHHYGSSYQFGGNVDEMLTEFDHYLFQFHDQFVEVIAAGIHFENHPTRPAGKRLAERPGWDWLSDSLPEERWTESGIEFRLRTTADETSKVVAASTLCDQVVVDLRIELDGRLRNSHRLCVRTRDGVTRSRWRRSFGNTENEFHGVAGIAEIRPLVERYATEVRERRTAMGKP